MAGLAVDGLISNLNTSEIIEALLFSQRAPALRLTTRRDATTSKLQAVQGLNASVLGVRVAAEGLANVSNFRARNATSTNTGVATATATTAAEPGAFTLSVQQLAAAQQISSDPDNVFTDDKVALNLEGQIRVNNSTVTLRATDTLRDIASRISNAGAGVSASVLETSPGEFRLSLRSLQTGANGFSLANASTTNLLEGLNLVDPGSDAIRNAITNGAASNNFNVRVLPVGQLLNLGTANVPSGTVAIANGSGSINVAIDLSTQSLEDIAAAINTAASGAGSAISAAVAEVSQGVYRLEINSGDGSAPSFTDAGNVLEALGVVRSAYTQVDQAGRDALFKVNGIDVVRSTNTVSDVITGVTFSLVSDATPTATTTISVTSDSEAAVNAVQSFVDAYNTTKGFIQRFASFNSENQQAGVLLGDSSVLGVESVLGGLVSRSVSTLPTQSLNTLNSGAGINPGSIQVTDRAGNIAVINLTEAETVQDVLDALNHAGALKVEAAINRAGTGIDIRDKSGGAGTLSIIEVDGGTTAAELGILGSSPDGNLRGRAVATPEFLSLGQLGISVSTDGTLLLDSTKLQNALSDNPEAVEAFFTQKNGFGEQARTAIDSLTDSLSGSLTSRATSLQETIDSYNESIKRIEDRLVMVEERLRRQFSRLEESLSQLQQQGDYLLAQLNQLGGSSGASKK